MVREIGIRIKKLRKKQKYSQQFIAEKLNISQSAYSLIESAHNNIMTGHVLHLADLYNVSTDYILLGKEKVVQVSTDNGFMPFINLEAVAGNADFIHNAKQNSEWDWYRIPNYKATDKDLIFEVEGDSMEPTLFHNDVIICEAKNSVEDLADNTLSVVVTSKGLFTKRFKKDSDGYCLLISDNPNYDPIKLNCDEIKAVLSVNGKITGRLNPFKSTDERKFQTIEDNIKHLETQISMLAQQRR